MFMNQYLATVYSYTKAASSVQISSLQYVYLNMSAEMYDAYKCEGLWLAIYLNIKKTNR